MCVESFELVKEDMGEVVGWKVFQCCDGKLYPLAQINGRRFLIGKWNKERAFRPNDYVNSAAMDNGAPFGFMAFTTLEGAERHHNGCNLCVIKKVKLRSVVAIGQQEVWRPNSTSPCYIARELIILDGEVSHE